MTALCRREVQQRRGERERECCRVDLGGKGRLRMHVLYVLCTIQSVEGTKGNTVFSRTAQVPVRGVLVDTG